MDKSLVPYASIYQNIGTLKLLCSFIRSI